MSEHLLSVKKREGIGRGHSRRLRAQGFIPAVIYGKSGNSALAVSERDFKMMMREVAGTAAVITLEDGDKYRIDALVHEMQRDPITDRFRHIDFLEVVKGQTISAHIPVHITGEPVGVKTEGGVLEVPVHELSVHCLPRNLPESIDIDVSNLGAGQAVHLRDVEVPEGVSFDGEPDMVIVAVGSSAKSKSDSDDDEAEASSEETTEE
ncbi:MAG: 50S ribosomal protein L25 [Verrucomicrobiota bacterium]